MAAGLKDAIGATEVGFTGGKFALSATNTTGALTSPVLPAKPGVTITGYTADPDGAGPLTSNADDITFTFPGVTYSGATTAGANGESVVVSLATNQATSGLALKALPAGLDLGWGTPGMGGNINSTNGSCAAVGAPYPSLGSTALSDGVPHVFSNTAKPTITGKLQVGKSLKCKPGTWSPAPTTTAFTWQRDGKAIKKATAAKYKIVKKDAGHKLSCTRHGLRPRLHPGDGDLQEDQEGADSVAAPAAAAPENREGPSARTGLLVFRPDVQTAPNLLRQGLARRPPLTHSDARH